MGSTRRRHGQIFCSMQNLHSPALWVKPEVRLHGCRTTAWMQEVEQRRSSCRGTTPWMEEVEPRLEQRPRATQEQLPNARSSATTRHKVRRASQANAGARHRCLTERAAQRRSERCCEILRHCLCVLCVLCGPEALRFPRVPAERSDRNPSSTQVATGWPQRTDTGNALRAMLAGNIEIIHSHATNGVDRKA